jgi:hypothetical protein
MHFSYDRHGHPAAGVHAASSLKTDDSYTIPGLGSFAYTGSTMAVASDQNIKTEDGISSRPPDAELPSTLSDYGTPTAVGLEERSQMIQEEFVSLATYVSFH